MAWPLACLLLFVLFPAHLFFPSVQSPAVDLAAFLLLALAGVYCLRAPGDGWLLPFLLALCGFLAVSTC